MTTAAQHVAGLTTEAAINPRTGKVWSITDPEYAERLQALKAKVAEPEKAKAFLRQLGVLNNKGKLTKRYGG